MAITIPGTDGDYIDVPSDASTYQTRAYRNLHRFSHSHEKRTERLKIVGDQVTYKGHPVRLWGTNISARAALENIAAWIPQMADELVSRGYNLVRLHHIDQRSAQGGIFADSPAANWYEQNATETGRLRDMIKALRRRGIWYTIDLNSYWGNGTEVTRIIWGQNAADIFGTTFVSSTINGAASSTTQTLVSVGDLAAGMGLHFVTSAAFRTIVSVNVGANTVTLDSTISTTNGETARIATDGFKQFPPINTAASNQLKAHANGLLSLDVSIEGEAGVTIGTDPHLYYLTVTNEHLPSFTLGARGQKVMDAWYGSAWAHTSAAARTAYATACRDYMQDNLRPWLIAQGHHAIPLAWGSQFGLTYTEYDILKQSVDVLAEHLYRHENGALNAVFDANEPHMQCASIEDIRLTRDPIPRVTGKPVMIEEWNSSYPQRYRHETLPLLATWGAINNISGMIYFDYADGSYNPASASIPHSRQYQVQGDRCRDIPGVVAASIYTRRDLNPLAQQTVTNRHFEDRAAKNWGVDTERTILLCGNLNAAKTFQRGQSIEVTAGERAVAFVTSFDALPIWEARRLLVGHVTYQIRRNVVMSDAWDQMTDAGSGNSCIRHGTADIRFECASLALPGVSVKVYRTSFDGTRGTEVTPTIVGTQVRLALAIDATNATFLYEVEVLGAPA